MTMTKKFWCHYIGRDDKPKRNNQELFNLTELFHDINNTDCKTPLWYEISGEYYLLYAQLSDKVAVLTREGSLYGRHLERLLKTDEQIEADCQDERWANSEKHFRDYWLNIIKQRQNYCDLLLEGHTWIDAATIRAFEEVQSPFLPVFCELRRQALADREAEYRKELEEHRKKADEEARKKAEAQAKDDAKIQKLVELGLLPDNLTKMQRGQVLAALEERGRYEVAGNQKVCCTVYELITEHGFNRMSHYQERYKRDGELLAKPHNYYDVMNDTLGYGYQINGRMGALMIERNKQ